MNIKLRLYGIARVMGEVVGAKSDQEFLEKLADSLPEESETHNCSKCSAPLIRKDMSVVDDPSKLLCHKCWLEDGNTI